MHFESLAHYEVSQPYHRPSMIPQSPDTTFHHTAASPLHGNFIETLNKFGESNVPKSQPATALKSVVPQVESAPDTIPRTTEGIDIQDRVDKSPRVSCQHSYKEANNRYR